MKIRRLFYVLITGNATYNLVPFLKLQHHKACIISYPKMLLVVYIIKTKEYVRRI
jgi:hypothetical protein